MTNNRVYNDAFRTFTFAMQQSVSFTYQLPYDLSNQDNSFNFRFQIGNGRQSKRLLANLGRILLFHYLFIFFIKTGMSVKSSTELMLYVVLTMPTLNKAYLLL